MSKELVNYKSSGAVVVKRSPAVSGKGQLAGSTLAKSKTSSAFHRSMSANIRSINKALKESEKILPRTHNNVKSKNA
ncbi:hypothetical protein [Bacillus sp. CECT 9360]|uniref:hypothetical protein n=1 Tax=Bacillus sp. CECT 9360 TaxID=2845821 RepID=UPI001E5A902E|nr:hypothetical protein [Bacillus sp. CECT 9360]CAH0346251.1 hypothetical protein BCI9360_02577 [Bacillus sp. CECT 9360]